MGFLRWIDTQFKEFKMFRRLIIVYCAWLVYFVTDWSVKFAMNTQLSGTDIAIVIAAIQVPVTLLLGHLLKLYNSNTDLK